MLRDYNGDLEKSAGLVDLRQMLIPPSKQMSTCSVGTKGEWKNKGGPSGWSEKTGRKS